MKQIKIVRVIARLNVGGPAIHTVFLTEGLSADGFDTHLITGKTLASEGDMSYLARERGVSFTVIPELGRDIRPWSDIAAFWKLFCILRREKPDIIHTHTAKAGALGRCAALLSGVPVKVHTFHGHVFESYFNPAKAKVFIVMERLFARFTDQVIVVSDTIKEQICGGFNIAPRASTSVIRLGLELGKYRAAACAGNNSLRRELGIDDKAILIGIVGRLTAVKNHRLFLEAARLIWQKKPPAADVKFVIIGGGELRQALEDHAAELGIKDKVIFTGWRKDMENVYAGLDIVVLTSLNEGTPLSLIEAMAAGKPVVATAVGGVTDLVENEKTGLLVESNNAARLTDAVLRLLKDGPLRKSLGDRASAHACATYSKERLVSDMKDLYRSLLEKKGIKINKGGQDK